MKSLLVTLDVSFLSLESRLAHTAFLSHSAIFLPISLHISSLCVQLHPTTLHFTLLSKNPVKSSLFSQVPAQKAIRQVQATSGRNLRSKWRTTFTTRPLGLCNSRLATPTHVLSPPSSNSTGYNTAVFAS